MERRLFEVKSPEDWPIRTPFPALIAKLNSVSEGENKCSISSLERICVPDDGRLFPYRIGEELPTIRPESPDALRADGRRNPGCSIA